MRSGPLGGRRRRLTLGLGTALLGLITTGCGTVSQHPANAPSPHSTTSGPGSPSAAAPSGDMVLPPGIGTATSADVAIARVQFGLVYNNPLAPPPPSDISAYVGSRSSWSAACGRPLPDVAGTNLVVVYAPESDGRIVAFITSTAPGSDLSTAAAGFTAPTGSATTATAWCTGSTYAPLS